MPDCIHVKALTTSQSASLAVHGEVKRGSHHTEPKAPLSCDGEAPTARSGFFTNHAWEDYEALARQTPAKDPGIPADVVDLALDHDWSAARAWREHLQLTQTQVAQGMGITQGAYAQLEPRKKIRKSSREKIAAALGLHESQLDF